MTPSARLNPQIARQSNVRLVERAQKGDACGAAGPPRNLFASAGRVSTYSGATSATKPSKRSPTRRPALTWPCGRRSRCKCKAMRAELAGPNASPLERLLADRAIACWLFLSYCEVHGWCRGWGRPWRCRISTSGE